MPTPLTSSVSTLPTSDADKEVSTSPAPATYLTYACYADRTYLVLGQAKVLKANEVLVYETDVHYSASYLHTSSSLSRYGAYPHAGRGMHGRTIGVPVRVDTKGLKEPATGMVYTKEGSRSLTLAQLYRNWQELKLAALKHPSLTYVIILPALKDVHDNDLPTVSGYDVATLLTLFSVLDFPANVVFPLDCYVHALEGTAVDLSFLAAEPRDWVVQDEGVCFDPQPVRLTSKASKGKAGLGATDQASLF